jgi:hypothetical protein
MNLFINDRTKITDVNSKIVIWQGLRDEYRTFIEVAIDSDDIIN